MMVDKLRAMAAAALALLMVTAPAAAAATAAAPQVPKVRHLEPDDPKSALFIGNSFFYFNNGINDHLLKLIRAADADAKFRITMVTISGGGLDWHDVATYFRPNAIGRYSFDSNNNIVFNAARNKLFDVAVLMDCSQCPLLPKLQDAFYASVKQDSDIVRRHGAAPVLFMSWAYQDRPEMTQPLAEAYTRAGNQNDALVIPAGLAFERATKQRADINLYASDKRHPSLAGTYLAAATTYAAMFGKSPLGLKYEAGLDHETANALQSVAWQTVQDFFRTP